MIEVILKEHVEHLGERGDVVKVAPGYARNYLLPRKLALAVTAGNKKQIEHEKKAAAAKAAEERAVAQALATRFAQTEVSFTRRASDTNQLFGSVTSADIAEALAAQGFDRRLARIDTQHAVAQLEQHGAYHGRADRVFHQQHDTLTRRTHQCGAMHLEGGRGLQLQQQLKL